MYRGWRRSSIIGSRETVLLVAVVALSGSDGGAEKLELAKTFGTA
jgi:hypothetical protein